MAPKNRRNEVGWVGPTIAAIVAALGAVFLFSNGLDSGPALPVGGQTTPAVAPAVTPARPAAAPEVPAAPAAAKSSRETSPRVVPVRPPGSLVLPAGALVKQAPQPPTMSCDDVLNLYETDVPMAILEEVVRGSGGPVPDRACLVDAGVEDELLEWLDELRLVHGPTGAP